MSTKGSLYFELDFIYFPSRLSLIILIKTWEKINYLTYMGSGLEVQIVKFKYSTLCCITKDPFVRMFLNSWSIFICKN